MLKVNEKRGQLLESLIENPPDLIIAGGGVTGAGIAREAAIAGLRVLLVDMMDFGWGSSSSSSKLVHGGLRYLKSGQVGVTYRSVKEREALMNELPGLIRPLDFILPLYSIKDKLLYKFALLVYDSFAGKKYHRFVSTQEMKTSFSGIDDQNLKGGYVYYDAQTDDMRLVIRILNDAESSGAHILNYAKVVKPVLQNDAISSVVIKDQVSNREFEIRCKTLINATGAATDFLRNQLGQEKLIRPLRGSHLVFSRERLPITKALGFVHPDDRRNVFVLPWNPPLLERNNDLEKESLTGVTVVGTTDLDHDQSNDKLPVISKQERQYLLKAVNTMFPKAALTEADIISTWSGIRPVVSSGAKDPSKESRDMYIQFEKGLLTVTGGKLTTFRNEALHALSKLSDLFPALKNILPNPFTMGDIQTDKVTDDEKNFIAAAYGKAAKKLTEFIQDSEPLHFEGTTVLKAAARFALQNEWVVHLDDLLIRRLRLGLLLPNGAKSVLSEIKQFCIEAGWSEKYYLEEEERYLQMIQDCYS